MPKESKLKSGHGKRGTAIQKLLLTSGAGADALSAHFGKCAVERA